MRIIAACILLFIASCASGPRMDASSPEAMTRSIETMTAGMTDEEEMKFREKLLMVILAKGCDRMDRHSSQEQSREQLKVQAAAQAAALVQESVGGLTVREILDWNLSEKDQGRAAACMVH